MALARARRRWELTPLGGFHLIGRIAPDQLGLNLPDRMSPGTSLVAELFACSFPLSLPATPYRRLSTPGLPAPALPASSLPAPVQQGPAGDSPPAFIGARRSVLRQ